MSASTEIIKKSSQSKNIITYLIVGLVFLVALWLSTQNEGPSKFPKYVTDQFTFTAWVNEGEDFLKKNYRWMTKIVAGYIKAWSLLIVCSLFLGRNRYVGAFSSNCCFNGFISFTLCVFWIYSWSVMFSK